MINKELENLTSKQLKSLANRIEDEIVEDIKQKVGIILTYESVIKHKRLFVKEIYKILDNK